MGRTKKQVTRRAEPNPGILEAIEKAEGQHQLAKMMGVRQPAVSYWLHVACPIERAIEIEEMLGVSRRKICPEVYA